MELKIGDKVKLNPNKKYFGSGVRVLGYNIGYTIVETHRDFEGCTYHTLDLGRDENINRWKIYERNLMRGK